MGVVGMRGGSHCEEIEVSGEYLLPLSEPEVFPPPRAVPHASTPPSECSLLG